MKKNKFDKKPKYKEEGDDFIKPKKRPQKNKQSKKNKLQFIEDYDEIEDLNNYTHEDDRLENYFDEEDDY